MNCFMTALRRFSAGVLAAVVLAAVMAAPALAGGKFALVIGVETYIPEELPSLAYAEDDALALAKSLEAVGFQVVTMTSQASNPLHRPGSAGQIMQQLEMHLSDRDPSDTIVVALSGHGVQFRGEDESWFCPQLAKLGDRSSLVAMSSVLEAMGACGAERKLLLVDACREELQADAGGKGIAIQELDPAAPARTAPPLGTIAVYSCRAREKSYELKDLGHSLFTHHVIAYLAGKAGADLYPGDELGVMQLASYVSSQTRADASRILGKSQKPEVFANKLAGWPLGIRPASPLKPGEVIENSLGMKLVVIPAGEFLMGSGEKKDEQPIHRVKITKPFLMGQTEVTQEHFAAVMGSRPWSGEDNVIEGPTVAASYVDWNDAVEFCRKLTARERAAGRLAATQAYRLPTEAEWEYACRAGTTTKWHFGNDESLLGRFAWYDGNAWDVGEKYAHRVGQKVANPWQLYDMHGNVWEWCGDWFGEDYYIASPAVDPEGPSSGSFRVVRGGSWCSSPVFCRSALRDFDSPSSRNFIIGFRVVRGFE